jgi:hypothetical protein
MAENDFHAYTSNTDAGTTNNVKFYHRQMMDHKPIHYVLEKRDGSLLHQTLDLTGSVESILKSIANALESSGAARITPPPSIGPIPQSTSSSSTIGDNIHWVNYSTTTNEPAGDGRYEQMSFIDDRYDINTNRGRDLLAFLNSVTPQQIEERRARRMDVSAAALVTRRLFSFQSVDGIRLGWSSESFAVLLSSLIRLHDEHSSKFHVSSFYPLRLVFSPDDGRRYEPLDVYGGNLFLNPAATHLEWLEALREVTTTQLEIFEANRQVTQERVRLLENKLGIQVKRGLSCSSLEYFYFLKSVMEPYEFIARSRIAASAAVAPTTTNANQLVPVTSTLETERPRLVVVVETPTACRRAKVTAEGTIRLPCDTPSGELDVAISRLSKAAKERWELDRLQQEECQQIVRQIKWELGLERVGRTRGVVRNHDFLNALSRMLDQRSTLRSHLSGYSLEIAGKGHQCSIADDGSLVVPYNWK